MPVILDGTKTAKEIRAGLAQKVAEIKAGGKPAPRLDVVLIGDDPASVTYVKMKQKACFAAGMGSEIHAMPSDTTQQQALDLIASLNANAEVNGILVQHPVPSNLDEQQILDSVLPSKDVDGIGSESLGRLVTGIDGFRPCTPKGIIRLLETYNVPTEGKKAVVIGRSIILGKPMALLLLEKNATVTICHSRTRELAEVIKDADIVVAALGKAEFVKGDWIKPGACVIDAGYNRLPDRNTDVGDVDYQSASEKAGWITPVPGGVGPMTIAMLMENTVNAALAG